MSSLTRARDLADHLTETRRKLHENAELSFCEVATTRIIADELKELGLEVTTWDDLTGAVGLLKGSEPGPTIALRADIDALPIEEATGAPYASKNHGAMHACAHDAHSAIVLGVARLLVQGPKDVKGNVKFIFQPGEETPPGGAVRLVDKGVLEKPHVDALIACHHATELRTGQIGIHYGQFLASADQFTLTVTCKGGGGSAPHKGVDGICVAAQIITALQYMVTRQIDPVQAAVLSFGTVHAGQKFNILADRVEMTGTCRALDPELARRYPDLILRVARGVAAAFNADVSLQYEPGYPPVVNDEAVTALVEESAKSVAGAENVILCPPLMAGDDLAYFLQKTPGSYFWLGTSNPERGLVYPAHTAKFDIDETAMPVATAVMLECVERYLASSSGASRRE